MKILIINSYHYLRGGDCRHVFGLADLLREHGHEVHHFAMKGRENLPCEDEGYFIEEIDYRKALERGCLTDMLQVLCRPIYSVEARKKLSRLLDTVRPHIVHIHSIRHHITKSILPELARRRIPVVWTLHDYKELCPNTSFYNGRTICEKCRRKKYWHVIFNRCKKGSLGASVVTFLEAVVNGSINTDAVALYVSPSRFLREKFIDYGYDPSRIVHIPNFLQLEDFSPNYHPGDYFLYIGRLEKEKGLMTLIEAFMAARATDSSLSLKIAGTGTLEGELRKLVHTAACSGTELLGFVTGDRLKDLTQKSTAIVIPSQWYENYPFSCLEAMAFGKPVIASRIGGIPEQVEDGVTGFLFEPFRADQLANKMLQLARMNVEEIAQMGRLARRKVESANSKERYFASISLLYKRLLEKKQTKHHVRLMD